ncbi:sortase domain-containing protein [Streptomyces albireticuli]|nr:sortase [Streptomyces albireticuli]MCD9141578.1 sortase [Streptomyces albireticuli]MCD9164171.1 sortase [Streptomyces albireticuli]MCD9189752.1 sortase [Streptomyces albireticuli]
MTEPRTSEPRTSPPGTRPPSPRTGGRGRLVTGVAWALLLLALWLWGRQATDGHGAATPTAGDAAAAGRPADHPLPPAHAPLPGARPQRLAIEAVGVRAPVEDRGPVPPGTAGPPPPGRAGTVGWYRGPQPGAPGAAVLVGDLGRGGHTGTGRPAAALHDLTALEPGAEITVTRADGTTAEFTVEDVSVYTKDDFDAHKVYGPRERDRAELRLIARESDGNGGRAHGPYGANVVVSAYLTGAGRS